MAIAAMLGVAAWAHATPRPGAFGSASPREGQPATERTEIRVVFDSEALYVAVMAFDSEPDKVVARILQRDRLMTADFMDGGLSFAGDDAVAILLDPFHDHRNDHVQWFGGTSQKRAAWR